MVCEDVTCTFTAWLYVCLRPLYAGIAQISEWHSIRILKNRDDGPGHCAARARRAVCCCGLERYKISVFLPCLRHSDHAVSAGLSAWQADATLHHNMLSRTWEDVCLSVCVRVWLCVCECVYSYSSKTHMLTSTTASRYIIQLQDWPLPPPKE